MHVAMIGAAYINYRPDICSNKCQSDHFIRRRNFPVGGKRFNDDQKASKDFNPHYSINFNKIDYVNHCLKRVD
jgi:hypothetical protein